jgi:hypothetical protein
MLVMDHLTYLLLRMAVLLILNRTGIRLWFISDDLYILIFDKILTILLILSMFVLIDDFGIACFICNVLHLTILDLLTLLRLCAVDYLSLLGWLLQSYYVGAPCWLDSDNLWLVNVYMSRFSSYNLWFHSNNMWLCPYYLRFNAYHLWFSSDDSGFVPNNIDLRISCNNCLLIADLWRLCGSGVNVLFFHDLSLFIYVSLRIMILNIYFFVLID